MGVLTNLIQGSSALTVVALGAFHCYKRHGLDEEATATATPIDTWKTDTIARLGLACIGLTTAHSVYALAQAGLSFPAIIPSITLLINGPILFAALKDYSSDSTEEIDSRWGQQIEISANSVLGAGAIVGALWLGSSTPTFALVLSCAAVVGGSMAAAGAVAGSEEGAPSWLYNEHDKEGPIVYFFLGAMMATMVSSVALLAIRGKEATLWRGLQPLASTATQATLAVGSGYAFCCAPHNPDDEI